MAEMRIAIVILAVLGAMVLASGCGGSDGAGPTPSPAVDQQAPDGPAADRALLRGALTVDGAAFDSRFVGAIVRRPDGLVAPCQAQIPGVFGGRYEIPVYAETEVTGCGATGVEVFLWTYVDDVRLVSNEGVAWPGDGVTADFDMTFSTATPRGGLPETTDFSGEVYDRDGNLVLGDALVEAHVGDVLCGVTSVRGADGFIGYIISVVGPDSVAGCDLGATVTFRIDGAEARETAVNGEPPVGSGGAFQLTVR